MKNTITGYVSEWYENSSLQYVVVNKHGDEIPLRVFYEYTPPEVREQWYPGASADASIECVERWSLLGYWTDLPYGEVEELQSRSNIVDLILERYGMIEEEAREQAAIDRWEAA